MKAFVLGAGAYGCALATVLDKNGHDVTVWSPIEKEIKNLNKNRETSALKGVKLSDSLSFTNDLKLLNISDLIVIAVPTEFLDDTCKKFSSYYNDQPICIATKGIEQGSCRFVYDIVKDNIDTNKISVLSGASFAIDIMNNSAVGISLASHDKATIDTVLEGLSSDLFKIRITHDIVGVEICGAIKNVIAIASGMLGGMKQTDSTKAMFLTESLHDIKSLIKGLGCNGDTVITFAGIGDLVLTSSSLKSRNYTLGFMIGEGRDKKEIEDYINNTTVEGLYTLKAIKDLVKDKDVDIPIINLIEEIVYHEKEPRELIRFLVNKD